MDDDIFGHNLRYDYVRVPSPKLSPCPGLYCGRTLNNNGTYSTCGPCPRGTYRASNSLCTPCDKDLLLYDWLYLGFMALLPLLFHFLAIERKKLKGKETMVLIGCSFLEVGISSIVTLLSWEPHYSFTITSCGVNSLSDWYPLFFNPAPNYESPLICTHEVVYPLFTLLLLFYALSIPIMLTLRILALLLGNVRGGGTVYAGLYFYPALALAHLVGGGVVYYVFPYVTVVGSVVSLAVHFAKRSEQGVKPLLVESVKNFGNLGSILCHWLLHAYGIVSITELRKWERDICFLALVPLPSILYILTVNFTDPSKLHGD